MPAFHFHSIASLPRLAWCASLTAGRDAAELWHGPWVETTDADFVEGAWDGDFAGRRFDQAKVLFGSGGQVDADGWLFATPTHMIAHLFALTFGRRFLISNSLAFLLAQAEDSLNPAHARYYFDFLRCRRRGLRQPPVGYTIPTARRRRIHLFVHTNLLVRPDLSLHLRPKTTGPAPTDFAAYRDLLRTSLRRLLANSADPRRHHRYQPIVALSQGFDSTAVAVLAPDCRQALTFITPPDAKTPGDNAAPIAAHLGLNLTTFDRHAYRQLPGAPEAEFCAGMSFGAWAPLAAAEEQLEGTFLLMGNYGDDLWTTATNKVLPDLLVPTDSLVEASSVNEFHLRTGFIYCPAPWIGAVHGPAIHRISTSAEMKPWRLGDKYDRPIPRRIAEESGIPRTAFGQHKIGGLHRFMSRAEAMSPAGYSDFQNFLAAHITGRPLQPGHGLTKAIERLAARSAGRLHMWLVAGLRRLPQSLYLRCLPLAMLPLRDLAHPSWQSPFLYTFHWGIERIRARYLFDSEPPP